MKYLLYLTLFLSVASDALHYKAATPIPPSVTIQTFVVHIPMTQQEDKANIMDKCDATCHAKKLKSISARRMGPHHAECHCAN